MTKPQHRVYDPAAETGAVGRPASHIFNLPADSLDAQRRAGLGP